MPWPSGYGPIAAISFGGDAVGDEPGQTFAVAADDAECAVPGSGQLAGGA